MTTKPAQNPDKPASQAAALLVDCATRHGFDDHQAAAYFGVPVTTWRNWRSGAREPSSAALRLLDVLSVVAALAPDIHAQFMPAPTAPRKPAGRKSRA